MKDINAENNKSKLKKVSMIDELKSMRNEWPEGFDPTTKVIPDKKKEFKKGKEKYKYNYVKEYNDEEKDEKGNER